MSSVWEIGFRKATDKAFVAEVVKWCEEQGTDTIMGFTTPKYDFKDLIIDEACREMQAALTPLNLINVWTKRGDDWGVWLRAVYKANGWTGRPSPLHDYARQRLRDAVRVLEKKPAVRLCAVCREPLSPRARADARFCSGRCRVYWHRSNG